MADVFPAPEKMLQWDVDSRALTHSVAGRFAGSRVLSAVWNLRQTRQFWRMPKHRVATILTSIGTLTSRPAAFLVLLAYAALWMIFDRSSLE
ncbi:hypothetical protein [Mesorhizobium sp. M0768]|uniref:hypothetical protein n=1 Tax=Mesorhizobium sp. M0768 TaxID=2956996 RepID=UPI00333AB781